MLNRRVYSAERECRERVQRERQWILELALPCQFGIWIWNLGKGCAITRPEHSTPPQGNCHRLLAGHLNILQCNWNSILAFTSDLFNRNCCGLKRSSNITSVTYSVYLSHLWSSLCDALTSCFVYWRIVSYMHVHYEEGSTFPISCSSLMIMRSRSL